jgi:multimeric flavodoxin WrbA
MKVVGVSCSLRKGSNTKILVELALAAASEAGAETQLLDMHGKQIAPCHGCLACRETGKCRINDDMQAWSEKIDEAQAIIFGTPVFFFNLAGSAKVLMDRLFPLYMFGKLASKVGGVIAVANSLGHTGVWQPYVTFFNAAHMLAADFVWAFAGFAEEVHKDRHAVQASKVLGQQVVDLAACGFKYPPAYPEPLYQHVANKYGINQSPHRGRFDDPERLADPFKYVKSKAEDENAS